ncbi:MAG: lamin tail domain-containing protein [Flavobacteriaceae bacterium]|nr:lamin tail domain-containing protein [Flavobacteriaceae bacterium]MCB0486087.1 lamin tail domain-containing protein [Flavobacteriaceae bacterium]
MKNHKYLIFSLMITLFGAVGCVEDAVYMGEGPEVGTSTVKLNEIMSTGDPDWLELYNDGTEAVDLSGYKLADTSQEWTIDNLTIPAKGFVTFDCDDSNIPNVSTNFKISSGGEKISLYNAAGELIDEVTTPDMSSQVGLTYGREVDGGDVWAVMSPTKGSANSNENMAPVLTAEPMTEFTDVYSVIASDADGISSVKLIYMVNAGVQSIDMALVDDEYKTSVPKVKVGDIVQYYVVATDNTGLKTYYPENGNSDPAEFTVIGGVEELLIEGAEAGYRGEVTFKAKPYYPDQVNELRLYYLLPGEMQDETNDDKTKVDMVLNGDYYEGTVPEQNTDDVVHYYIRVEYTDGTKTYYPLEEEGSDFDHDLGTTWPSYTVEEKTYDPVVDQTVNSTQGPLTSATFPTNPVPGTDINVVLTYSSTVDITEARIYFAVGDNPVYEKDNKVKGEDDGSFTQTGVTINLKDVLTIDNLSLSESGAKVSFYVRLQDADGYEYYYANDGTMYIDESGAGGSTDQSDDFKADTSLWNVYNVQ